MTRHQHPRPTSVTPPRTVTALIIPAMRPPHTVHIAPDLATLQRLVGGPLEAVSGDGWHAYLNQEGKFDGLPLNVVATALLFLGVATGQQLGITTDWVAGDVLVLGDDPDGDEGDAPADLIQRLRAEDIAPMQLLAAIPYLTFRPADAVILIGLAGRHIDSFWMTSLAGLPRPSRPALDQLVAPLAESRSDSAIVAIVTATETDEPIPHRRLAQEIRAALAVHDVEVVCSVWASDLLPGTSWKDHDTGAGGSMPDLGGTATALEQVLAGRVSACPGGPEGGADRASGHYGATGDPEPGS